MHSLAVVPLVLLVSLFWGETALGRPQMWSAILQVDGTGIAVDEVPLESTITTTSHRTVIVSKVENTAIADSASGIATGTGDSSINTQSSTVLATDSASSSSLSTAVSKSTTTSSSTSASSTSADVPAGTPSPTFIRGVNLGGWLVLEKWMDWNAFTGPFADATDQWTFDSIPGAREALMTHWSTYITEGDISTIAATGINALRIPIGFWAYDNSGTPYIQGADVFLEKAIGWARAANMKVWVDLHGAPGSQNGFDNSGHAGAVEWQQPANLARTITVLQTMATKYGALEYADVVIGLELINEPISWGANSLSTTQSWARAAIVAVHAAAANPSLAIVMHDAFAGPLAWTDLAKSLSPAPSGGGGQFAIDTHLYQLFTPADNALTQAQHIAAACAWSSALAAANAVVPVFVGEWSGATNICVNPDGSTSAGTACDIPDCQCESADFDTWNDALVQQARRFIEAQLDVFERSAAGWFVWAAKGPGGWGFLEGVKKGVVPDPVTSRRYPGQCAGLSSSSSSGSTRRSSRGVRGGEGGGGGWGDVPEGGL